jgi:hypothetical protein
MQALLDPAPPPAPRQEGGERIDGAQPTATKVLPPGRDRFIPVSRYDRLLDVDGLDRATSGKASA